MALDKEKLNKFRKHRESLGCMLSEASNVINNLSMSSAAENLAKLGKKVNDDTFKIQVIGTFSNGKSTVINALLGEEVLPAYSLPTTAVINEIKYGEKKEAILYFRNPLPDKIASSLSEKAWAHMKRHDMKNIPPLHINYEEIEDYVVIPIGENPYEMLLESPYEKVELYWPLPMLKEGVEIIDSPGLNESDTRSRVTMEYLSKADAIILVFCAERLCAKDEMEFVQNYLYDYGFTDPFFVVNKFDLIQERERERMKKFAQLKLSEFTTNPIYYISAQNALDGLMADNQAQIRESGFITFVSDLTNFLTKDKGRIKLSQPAQELKRLLNNEALYKVIPGQRAMLDKSLDDVKKRYEAAKPQLDHLRTKKEQLIMKIKLKIEQSKSEFRRAVERNTLNVINMIPGWVKEYKPKHSLGLVPTKSKASALVVEMTEMLNKKISDQQRKWKHEVMLPLANNQAQYIFESAEHDLSRLLNEIDAITIQISGDERMAPKDVPVWQRVAGAAGGLLLGCPDIALAAGMNGISKELVKNMAFVLGTEAVLAMILGLTNPFVLVGGLVAALLGGGWTGEAAMKELKNNISQKFVETITTNSHHSTHETVESIASFLSDLSSDISIALDNEIKQTEEQVEHIMSELKKGRDKVEAQKKTITVCETKIKAINTELDAFIFELINQK